MAASPRTPKGRSQRQSSGHRKQSTPARDRSNRATDHPSEPPAPPREFRVGIVEGVMPGTWIERWRERLPDQPIALTQLDLTDQLSALIRGDADVVIGRLPVHDLRLHVIELYAEDPVVVMSADSDLTAADVLHTADLTGEVRWDAEHTPLTTFEIEGVERARQGALPTHADVVATVASGAGIAIMPMSIARLHQRKDASWRLLDGAPKAPVGLIWLRSRDADDVQTFVGIVRGRRPSSSR